ncbi:universal stress protein [Diaphorobacter aerolatus]|uniref:Universal stress protein n=1 Tax=Diaphorobacter aerolatus TaxID=1288495 RepID=A0A7H0GHP7_9BURK|nr:universal stress protein [Diaphorobacter aerolatus]QNP47813.1 universal stress protein [Diaphorobacter aerolatus]
MHIQNIAALTDFSTQAEQALDRAALLAAQHEAILWLVYATDEQDPRFANPQARLEQRARQLARRHSIDVVARDFDGYKGVAERAMAAAAGADLLVLDRRVERLWNKPWRGAALAHCLRYSPCPVLVVQQACASDEDDATVGESYARMLVAVTGSPRSREVLHFAAGLQQDTAVDLFQSRDPGISAPQEESEFEVLEQLRDELKRETAEARRLRIKDADDARRNRVDSQNGTRDVTRQIMVQQQRSGADLIVIGAPRKHWADRWALSARGARLASLVTCDVLVCGQLPQERDRPLPIGLGSRKGWLQFRF